MLTISPLRSFAPACLGRRTWQFLTVPLLGAALLLGGCAGPQSYSTTQIQAPHLEAGNLRTYGLAFITPSSATGQEEDKQALALAFGEILRQARPNLRIVSLSDTLSAVNRSGITGDYKRMFEDYRVTGMFDQPALQKVAEVT